ncbi:hypothetical protein BWD162_001060 [Bartonella sp. WD16.2]|nr:hypothetical protein BWD162_001060 [Bartonella sp. WD16.2]
MGVDISLLMKNINNNFHKIRNIYAGKMIMKKKMLKKLWDCTDKKVIAAIIFCLKSRNSEESLKQLAELQDLLDKKD